MFQNISGETDSRKKVEVNFIIFLIMADIIGKLGSDKGNVVTVDSPELLNELIQNNEKTLKLLDGVNIKKTEISVSTDGRVQIANKVLFDKLKDGLTQLDLSGVMQDDQNKVCTCNSVCHCNTVCHCNPQTLNDFLKLASNPKDYLIQTPNDKENVLTRK